MIQFNVICHFDVIVTCSTLRLYYSCTIPAKKLNLEVCLIYTLNKLYETYESCVNKIIFLFNNTFFSLFILFVFIFIIKNKSLKKYLKIYIFPL